MSDLRDRIAYSSTAAEFATLATEAIMVAEAWMNNENRAEISALAAVFLELRALRLTLEAK